MTAPPAPNRLLCAFPHCAKPESHEWHRHSPTPGNCKPGHEEILACHNFVAAETDRLAETAHIRFVPAKTDLELTIEILDRHAERIAALEAKLAEPLSYWATQGAKIDRLEAKLAEVERHGTKIFDLENALVRLQAITHPPAASDRWTDEDGWTKGVRLAQPPVPSPSEERCARPGCGHPWSDHGNGIKGCQMQLSELGGCTAFVQPAPRVRVSPDLADHLRREFAGREDETALPKRPVLCDGRGCSDPRCRCTEPAVASEERCGYADCWLCTPLPIVPPAPEERPDVIVGGFAIIPDRVGGETKPAAPDSPQPRRWTLHWDEHGEQFTCLPDCGDNFGSGCSVEVIDAAYADARIELLEDCYERVVGERNDIKAQAKADREAIERVEKVITAGKYLCRFDQKWDVHSWLGRRVSLHRWFEELANALRGGEADGGEKT